MNWTSLADAESWKGRATELFWKFSRKQNAPPSPSWQLDPQQLNMIVVRWPRKYQWAPAARWVEPLLQGFRRFVKTEFADIPQSYPGVVVIQIAYAGQNEYVAIDYSDYPAINSDCARQCVLYMKMQFPREGYIQPNVQPGGFVPASDRIYEFLPHVRALSASGSYRIDVYGRFGREFATEIRARTIKALSDQKVFSYVGGFCKLRYSSFLKEIAQSKICIDLPGNGDFCFRLVDYFAVGACVVAFPHKTLLHRPLVNHENIVYAQSDLCDLVELCTYYLEDDTARQKVCQKARQFFDRYLHRDQIAAYYLHSYLEKICASTNASRAGDAQ